MFLPTFKCCVSLTFCAFSDSGEGQHLDLFTSYMCNINQNCLYDTFRGGVLFPTCGLSAAIDLFLTLVKSILPFWQMECKPDLLI